MVAARASGTLIASSLKQNTFLTLECTRAGGHGGAQDEEAWGGSCGTGGYAGARAGDRSRGYPRREEG